MLDIFVEHWMIFEVELGLKKAVKYLLQKIIKWLKDDGRQYLQDKYWYQIPNSTKSSSRTNQPVMTRMKSLLRPAHTSTGTAKNHPKTLDNTIHTTTMFLHYYHFFDWYPICGQQFFLENLCRFRHGCV